MGVRITRLVVRLERFPATAAGIGRAATCAAAVTCHDGLLSLEEWR